jgi:hypothetical protein
MQCAALVVVSVCVCKILRGRVSVDAALMGLEFGESFLCPLISLYKSVC